MREKNTNRALKKIIFKNLMNYPVSNQPVYWVENVDENDETDLRTQYVDPFASCTPFLPDEEFDLSPEQRERNKQRTISFISDEEKSQLYSWLLESPTTSKHPFANTRSFFTSCDDSMTDLSINDHASTSSGVPDGSKKEFDDLWDDDDFTTLCAQTCSDENALHERFGRSFEKENTSYTPKISSSPVSQTKGTCVTMSALAPTLSNYKPNPVLIKKTEFTPPSQIKHISHPVQTKTVTQKPLIAPAAPLVPQIQTSVSTHGVHALTKSSLTSASSHEKTTVTPQQVKHRNLTATIRKTTSSNDISPKRVKRIAVPMRPLLNRTNLSVAPSSCCAKPMSRTRSEASVVSEHIDDFMDDSVVHEYVRTQLNLKNSMVPN